MRNFYKTILLGLAAILSVVALSVVPSVLANGSGTFSFTPNTGSPTQGSSFTITLYENSGTDTINTIRANITYDSGQLQFVSLDADSNVSDFGIKAAANGGGGDITFQMANLTPLSSKHRVGTITFKALGSSGSTSLSFKDSSVMLTNTTPTNDVWNHDTNPAATYSLKPKPSSSGTKSPSSGGSTSNATSSSPSSSTTSKISPSTSQQKSDPTAPVPASKVSNTNATYLVAIKVVDNSSRPVKNAKVSLAGNTVTSSSNGLASFFNIAPGSYTVTVSAGNLAGKATILVDSTKPTTAVQEFQVKIKSKYNWLLYTGIALIIILIVVIVGIFKGGLLSKIRAKKQLSGLPTEMPKTVASNNTAVLPTNNVNDSATSVQKDNTSSLLKPTVITPNSGSSDKI